MRNTTVRAIIGSLLIILGILFIVDNFYFFTFPFPLTHYFFSWPVILIMAGIIILIASRNNFVGYVLLIIGILALVRDHYHLTFRTLIHDYWPVMIIGLGLYLLIKKSESSNDSSTNNGQIGKKKNYNESQDDYIDEFTIFGGSKKNFVTKNFKGGKVTTIFGGSEIDLTNSELANGRQVIDIFILFGGIDLYIPKNWKVVMNVTPIFGGFDNPRRKDTSIEYEENKTLVIKGFILFGGGDIKN
ncbi:LiaI-LiaF-like domain-containing protein [Bacteroidota bacterium]